MILPTWPVAYRRAACLAVALCALVSALPAQALRVVDYNILNYPGSSGPARAPYYRTILSPLTADIIVTEEMSSPTSNTQFLNDVLNVMEPGQWATVPFIDGNDTDASFFYRTSKVQFLGQWAFYPNPANQLRFVHVYRLKPVGYTGAGAELRLYTAHLKASTGYESQRLAECTGLRDSMNAMPSGTHALICGDMNFYTQSAETGYAKLLQSQADNDGRVYDVLPAGSWHDGAGFAVYHTQSPCKDGTCASGGANGGMDDRFDMLLPTLNLGTGQGLSVIPGTMKAVGNDGLHFNGNIDDAPVIPEGAAYATALKLASDHLPVRVDLRLPAMITADPSLAFGTVIVGATAPTQELTLTNPAEAGADSLNCAFAAPAGYDPLSHVVIPAGDAAQVTVTMTTSVARDNNGDLSIASDAPDSPTTLVALTGKVLGHAVASLDSTTALHSGLVDFGNCQPGTFLDKTASVFNFGYGPLQARLSVNNGVITGGDGRFAFVDGFTSSLIADTKHAYVLTFNDTGAPLDSTYTATLTFSSGDEPLPGGTTQPDLVVSLRARVTNTPDNVVERILPTATRLFQPTPNPLVGHTTVRLDLARTTEVSLAVFDPTGRQVATLRQGTLSAGQHSIAWDGRSNNGTPLGSGMYFLRLSAPGLHNQVVRLTLVR